MSGDSERDKRALRRQQTILQQENEQMQRELERQRQLIQRLRADKENVESRAKGDETVMDSQTQPRDAERMEEHLEPMIVLGPQNITLEMTENEGAGGQSSRTSWVTLDAIDTYPKQAGEDYSRKKAQKLTDPSVDLSSKLEQLRKSVSASLEKARTLPKPSFLTDSMRSDGAQAPRIVGYLTENVTKDDEEELSLRPYLRRDRYDIPLQKEHQAQAQMKDRDAECRGDTSLPDRRFILEKDREMSFFYMDRGSKREDMMHHRDYVYRQGINYLEPREKDRDEDDTLSDVFISGDLSYEEKEVMERLNKLEIQDRLLEEKNRRRAAEEADLNGKLEKIRLRYSMIDEQRRRSKRLAELSF